VLHTQHIEMQMMVRSRQVMLYLLAAEVFRVYLNWQNEVASRNTKQSLEFGV